MTCPHRPCVGGEAMIKLCGGLETVSDISYYRAQIWMGRLYSECKSAPYPV